MNLPTGLPAAELLVTLLRGSAAPIEADPGTWLELIPEAGRNGIAAMLHPRLRAVPDRSMPAGVRALAQQLHTRNALNNALIFRECAELIDLLGAQRIPVMLLKGVHLAAAVYEHPALRSMADIDLMVPLDRLADAEQAMRAAGYDGARHDLAEWIRGYSHLPRLRRAGGRAIEVHWTIERPTSPFAIRPADLWARARPLRLEGHDAFGLGPADMLLHLCVHAAYHHRLDHMPLKQLCDVDALLRRDAVRLDWNDVADTARTWGVEPYVRLTLTLARDLLAAAVPDEPLRLMSRPPEEATLLAAARGFVLNRPVAVPHTVGDIEKTQGLSSKFRVLLRNVFPPPRRLAHIYGLPVGSPRVYLWYFGRPLDLLMRRGRATFRLLAPRIRARRKAREDQRGLVASSLDTWDAAAGTGRPTGNVQPRVPTGDP